MIIDTIVGVSSREKETLIPMVTGASINRDDRGLIIAKTLVNPFSVYKYVSIDERPVSFDSYLSGSDSNVRATRGIYTIKYISRPYKKNMNFEVAQDLIGGAIYVTGWKHFCALCHRVPELAWIKRNCRDLGPDLFGLAKAHPGLGFQFTIDWIRYAKKITEIAKNENIDIDHKPYVAFRCSLDDFNNKYRYKVIGDKKDLSMYHDELKEIEHEFCDKSNTVQEEEE